MQISSKNKAHWKFELFLIYSKTKNFNEISFLEKIFENKFLLYSLTLTIFKLFSNFHKI